MHVFLAAHVILGPVVLSQGCDGALIYKPLFPQASVKDRAGVFLHRISSGIRPSFTLTNNRCVVSYCAFYNSRYLVFVSHRTSC